MIDFDMVHRLAPWRGLIDGIERAHLLPRPMGERLLMTSRAQGVPPGEQPDALILVPAWQPGTALGVKLVTSFPRNVMRHGLPTVDALYVLFDAETGKARTVLDGEALVFRKTAADTALGARFLAPPDARRLLMVGAGGLAPYVIAAIRAVRPGLEEARIWNRTPARADALAQRVAATGMTARTSQDLEADLGWADIVISATMATRPLIRGALVKRGAHVGLIGSFTPDMREGDDALLARAAVFADDRGALVKSGEFTDPIARGVFAEQDLRGDLWDLCRGKVQPPGAGQVTLFKNGGAPHLDLFTAQHVMESLAREA